MNMKNCNCFVDDDEFKVVDILLQIPHIIFEYESRLPLTWGFRRKRSAIDPSLSLAPTCANVSNPATPLSFFPNESDRKYKVVMKDPEDIAAYRKSIERQWVHIFLVGLDGYFEQVRGEILRKDPLPDQSKTNHPKIDHNIDKSIFKCTHCNKTGHTKSHCFEIVEYPDWWDHNRDQRKKDSKKTSIAVVTEIKEANVIEKASALVAATDYGDKSHPLDLPHKKLFPQPMVTQPQSLGKDP
ncbi:hypothetical protein CK203_034305 [Vitis vinifera]|uniref:Uncharacterized protein n=1 Tax=Vitis vinifera TaxID=29760 RepID=A0A438INP1_VITVI|nr:hypothetical protein CK203_034305 [Vitis vinifera]